MDTFNIGEIGVGRASLHAASILRNGGVILYPTDTLYGLGADAFSDSAVEKVYVIKGRDSRKPMHAIFADMKMVEEYAELNDVARRLAERFLPGPLTLVLKKKSGIDSGICRGIDTVGVRIPDNAFCIATAASFGKPFTATSANLAGHDTESSIEKILQQFAKDAKDIETAIDAGVLPMQLPSTVVNVVSGHAVILRQGAIPSIDIENALK